MKVKLALIALCFPYAALFAQSSEKVVTRSTMVGIGSTNVLDTYLSDEHFKGTGVSFLATVERQRTDKKWATIMEHEGNISSCNSRHTQQELEGAYNFYWGKIYRWQLLDGALSLQAGGLLNASLGFIYNTSNGNNPAQARAHLNVMPTGVASYRFQLFNKQFVARYELALPLLSRHLFLTQLRTVILRNIQSWRLRPQCRRYHHGYGTGMAQPADTRCGHHA